MAGGRKLRKSSMIPSASFEGWQLPKKPARRTSAKIGVIGVDASSPGVAIGEVGRTSKAPDLAEESGSARPSVRIPGTQASLKAPLEWGPACRSLVSVLVQLEDLRLPEPSLQKISLNTAANPFALVGSDKWAGRSKARKEAYPGPLKRARPVESLAPQVFSKPSKGKGKLFAPGNDDVHATFVFSAAMGDLKGRGTLSDKGPKLTQTEEVPTPVGVSEVPQQISPGNRSHDSVVCLLKKAIQLEQEVQAMDSQDQGHRWVSLVMMVLLTG